MTGKTAQRSNLKFKLTYCHPFDHMMGRAQGRWDGVASSVIPANARIRKVCINHSGELRYKVPGLDSRVRGNDDDRDPRIVQESGNGCKMLAAD